MKYKDIETLKQKIKAGKPVIGTFNTLNSCSVTEILSFSDLDFQILDLEHGSFDLVNISNHISASRSNSCYKISEVLIRNPSFDRWSILQCLDQGANGLVFPHIENSTDLSVILDCISYPPVGKRSFSPFTKAGMYGSINYCEYAINSNSSQVLVIIIESSIALANLQNILELFSDRIDVVYFGSYDLSADLGYLGNPWHPNVTAAIQEGIELCGRYSISTGAYVPNSLNQVSELLQMGHKFITFQVDADLLRSSYASIAHGFQELI